MRIEEKRHFFSFWKLRQHEGEQLVVHGCRLVRSNKTIYASLSAKNREKVGFSKKSGLE